MQLTKKRVGVDVGGVFVKIVVLDENGQVQNRLSERHHGNPVKEVQKGLRKLGLSGPVAVGVTGACGHLVAGGLNLLPVDPVSAEIKAVRHIFPEARNIVNVGGSSVTLIQLDANGDFIDYNTNSLCAAGTGSFLDQQATRIGMRYEDMGDLEHHEEPPSIATRCSVFAKSDLIHRQQEGYSKSQLWCGLCKSMTGTFLNTLLRGRPLSGPAVLTGGVARNSEVLRWLKARYGDLIRTYEDAPFSGAIGAAHMTNGHVDDFAATIESLHDTSEAVEDAPRRPPLGFKKTVYPSFDVAESYTDEAGNEVRVTCWPQGAAIRTFLGLDVGSTSTKVLLMDEDEKVIADIYRRTAGDPVQAVRYLLAAIQELATRKESDVTVLGAATTGSGRKLAAHVIGADLAVNEITAHLAGAMHVDDRIDTIFEIGGQDAKYIHARNGRIVDSNMNYVCAAGTGSFVEEQANKLGVGLNEIGDIVMGIAPPVTSDRCTVFMEQDVERLIRRGYTREECVAAVLCSVVKNYLNKVVGRRHVSRERIFFQGATARNKGLVAAFEGLLGVEVVVSPYCHVMGSYGAALLVKRELAEGTSQFKGLDLARRKIALSTETCELCQNHCKITFAEIEGETKRASWGYMCGRDPDETHVRVRGEFKPFRKRLSLLFEDEEKNPETAVKTIGIPRSLITYSMYPFWRTFFRDLGFRVKLSQRTNDNVVRRGNELTAADFCHPVKIAHGHAAELAADENVDFVFLPHLISHRQNPSTTNSYFCPFVQSSPSTIRSALTRHGVDASRLLTPVVDFSLKPRSMLKELASGLAKPLGVDRNRIRDAFHAGLKAQQRFEDRRREEGRRILQEIEESGRTAIVIVGRPYNTLDLGANLALPQKIADLGYDVIPMDMLPYDVEELNPAFKNMYWSYGQHILAAGGFIRNHKNLYPIYFSNFSCGPDSFLLSLFETVMGEKPMLTLELDEHGGDAGYLTRVEAFVDVIKAWEPVEQKPFEVPTPEITKFDLREKTFWLPNMHPIGGPLYAAALTAGGLSAKPFPQDTRESFDLGRSLTRGSECMPTACTTGGFVNILRDRDPSAHALFMPTSDGPCRFGQYTLLQRLVLNDLGYGEAAILAPSSRNGYQGLNTRLRVNLWEAVLASDMLWKAACKVRPYEVNRGQTDEVVKEQIERISQAWKAHDDHRAVFREAIKTIAAVPVRNVGSRPLVGVVGEIFVRCNLFCNDSVIRSIEEMGGEAWLTPMSEWMMYTAELQRWRAREWKWNLPRLISAYTKNIPIYYLEHVYEKLASPFLDDRREPPVRRVIEHGTRYLPVNFSGESILTLGRATAFAEQGASLVVNVAPFGCMPGTITSALCREVQTEKNVPIVSLFYDGEPGINQRLKVFLTGVNRYNAPGRA